MIPHAQTLGDARWSDASESYLVSVACSCGNVAVGIANTPETAGREGRARLGGYCVKDAER